MKNGKLSSFCFKFGGGELNRAQAALAGGSAPVDALGDIPTGGDPGSQHLITILQRLLLEPPTLFSEKELNIREVALATHNYVKRYGFCASPNLIAVSDPDSASEDLYQMGTCLQEISSHLSAMEDRIELLRHACRAFAAADQQQKRVATMRGGDGKMRKAGRRGGERLNGNNDIGIDSGRFQNGRGIDMTNCFVSPARVASLNYDWAVCLNDLAFLERSLFSLSSSSNASSSPSNTSPFPSLQPSHHYVTLLEEACVRLAHAVEAEPAHPQALNNWGLVLQELSRDTSFDSDGIGRATLLAAAVEKFRAAIYLRPDFDRCCYNLGTVLHALAAALQTALAALMDGGGPKRAGAEAKRRENGGLPWLRRDTSMDLSSTSSPSSSSSSSSSPSSSTSPSSPTCTPLSSLLPSTAVAALFLSSSSALVTHSTPLFLDNKRQGGDNRAGRSNASFSSESHSNGDDDDHGRVDRPMNSNIVTDRLSNDPTPLSPDSPLFDKLVRANKDLYGTAAQYICLARALRPTDSVYRSALSVVRNALPLPFL
eukprot:CAMPEP_0175083200 /NCGR_PEP_ID=MMETSP0052_2-20121109/27215_1 /TAXON_ID=51329 ORGANISM="Polytomella parva, Strain SAG 63-3" /NCGR_SAMPLE_ID=MMETSP0052_2 /ASSEMBLY_ACC=CAM_ASM_000194 /LENGTH=541 /DNA_ID=CAMNT_0016354553 /DNA_START=114 /DNA_END=1735 /DNA_ORIENTATION=+